MSVSMALMDFVPVLLFLAAWVLLLGDLKNKFTGLQRGLVALGAAAVFVAGLLKAVWKLQIALGAAPVALFNRMFFPTQSVGFVLMALGMLAFLYGKKHRAHALTMVFVMLTVLGNLGAYAGLVNMAAKVKKAAVPLFILAFVLSMMMGYLSSRDFAQASMHWVAQSVNTLAQGLLLWGAVLLHRGGLSKAESLTA